MLNKKYINKNTLRYRMNNGVRVELKIPKKLLDRLDAHAEKAFETRASLIRRIINKYLNEVEE